MKTHTVSEQEAVSILKKLLVILEDLHNMNPPIIHRDIKPENIFYDGNELVLGDFDIARVYDASKTKDTTVLGSVGYAAPEQFGFNSTGVTTDLYACGVLFNVLLTGDVPYRNAPPKKYRDVIAKATSTLAEDRYQSAHQMIQSIEYASLNKLSSFNDLKKSINESRYKETVPLRQEKLTLVGFRSHVLWKQVMALAYYVLAFFMSYTAQQNPPSKTFAAHAVFTIWLFFTLVYPLVYLFNYVNIWFRCPFRKSKYFILRVFGIVFTFGVTYIGISIIYVILNDLLQ